MVGTTMQGCGEPVAGMWASGARARLCPFLGAILAFPGTPVREQVTWRLVEVAPALTVESQAGP